MSAKERFDQISALFRTGQLEKAAAGVASFLKITPHDPNFLHLAGLIAEAQGELPRAAMFFERALIVHPNWFEASYNLARVLSAQKKYDEAIALMTKASLIEPNRPHIWESLANFCLLSGDLPSAIAHWKKALSLMPQRQDWRAQILLLSRQICDWSEALTDLATLPPQAVTVLVDDPALHHQSAVTTAHTRFGGITALPPASFPAHKKLRIGYLSSDFHAHATAYLMAELFALHNKDKFETYVYSYGVEDDSSVRQRIKEEADHFIDLRQLRPKDAAERIRQDEIDILVDLKGYTRGNQLEILAHRPAPKQIHWLGYPGTLGAPFIDFFVGDTVTIPRGYEKFFTERVICLPHCYQINDRRREVAVPKSRAAYGLPEEAFVLASFNQTYKITPEVFSIWCDLLKELPTAVLWLYESNVYAPENLRKAAAAQDIDPSRLIFASPLPLAEHLARYAVVDLSLDTFPVGGHTTTSDSLWVGTPVVTMTGQSFVTRVAASILSAAGLAELVTTSPEAYRTLVLDLARNPARLRQIRRYLETNRLTLPLFDTPTFVKNWETALEQIHTFSPPSSTGESS